MFKKALISCLVAGGLSATPALARVHFYVGFGPPAPVVETAPVSPGAGYVWTPGYYNYANGGYVWVNGAWRRPPLHRHAYVAGAWVHGNHGWYHRDGHWR